MKIGTRVVVTGYDVDENIGSTLLGEKGTVVKKVNPSWTCGSDVVVDLDCGLTGLLFNVELELDVL